MVPVSSTLEVLSKKRCALYETHVSSLAWNAINMKYFFSHTYIHAQVCFAWQACHSHQDDGSASLNHTCRN